jgi:hypothetical protein
LLLCVSAFVAAFSASLSAMRGYAELRKLAAQKLAQEKPGQTLQATALVHEAYLRLVDTDRSTGR